MRRFPQTVKGEVRVGPFSAFEEFPRRKQAFFPGIVEKGDSMVAVQTPICREMTAGRLRPGSARGGVNVGEVERWLSLAGGGLLAVGGLSRGSLGGFGLAA